MRRSFLTSLNYGSRRDPKNVAGGETTGKGEKQTCPEGTAEKMGTEQLQNAMELSGAAFRALGYTTE